MRGLLLLLFSLAVSVGSVSAKTPEWDRAHELYQRTEYSQALRLLEPGSRTRARTTLQLIGQCHFMQGDYKKAAEAFEKALALAPRNSELHRLAGQRLRTPRRNRQRFHGSRKRQKSPPIFRRSGRAGSQQSGSGVQSLRVLSGGARLPGRRPRKGREAGQAHRQAQTRPPRHHAQAQLERKRKRYDAAEEQLRQRRRAGPAARPDA